MKKSVFVYGSLLAALLAEGADLTRAEINRKLAELEKSKPPTKLSPGAMCYKMAMPALKRQEFTCSKCGAKTIYQAWEWNSTLSIARHLASQVALMRKLELNIQLDDSELCSVCAKDKRVFETAYVKVPPDTRYMLSGQTITLPPATRIKFSLSPDLLRWEASPEFWAKSSAREDMVSPETPIYIAPDEKSAPVMKLPVNIYLPIAPKQPGDPAGWVRVVNSRGGFVDDAKVLPANLPPIPQLYWIITIGDHTRSIPVKEQDDKILLAFLNGKNRFDAEMGNEVPLKSYLPRLLELLGKSLKTEEKP